MKFLKSFCTVKARIGRNTLVNLLLKNKEETLNSVKTLCPSSQGKLHYTLRFGVKLTILSVGFKQGVEPMVLGFK